MKNEEFLILIEEQLGSLAGYYSKNNRQRLAIFFDDAPETSQVKGLEVNIRPKTSGYRRIFNYANKTRTSVHFFFLIQHEGEITIYDAEEKMKEFFDKECTVLSFETREDNKPDIKQQRKPVIQCRVEFFESVC